MAYKELRAKALALRLQGKSYSQIKTECRVSKSTLSYWLHAFPLSQEQLYRLNAGSQIRIEKYMQTRAATRQAKLDKAYKEESKIWLPLTKREALLAGYFLYWGEGGKTSPSEITISNTDPRVIQFAVYWFTYGLGMPKQKITAKLHLYSDMDEEREIRFWMDKLGFEREQFKKTYLKKTSLSGLTYRGFGHGTCNIRISNVFWKRKIMMGIKAIADYYASKLL